MNSVSRVKALCKERKIPIYRLEKDLGYANGYIGQLKKGSFPDDRLVEIAHYLGVTPEFLLTGEERKKAPATSSERYEGLSVHSASMDSFSDPERELIRKFRCLDSRGQAAVMNILNFEYNSLPGEQAQASSN